MLRITKIFYHHFADSRTSTHSLGKILQRLLIVAAIALVPDAAAQATDAVDPKTTSASAGVPASDGAGTKAASESTSDEAKWEQPWDFLPYRVLIWIVSDDPRVNSENVGESLQLYLDRDFRSIWRVDIADAPAAVATASWRDLDTIDFETIAASDPVIAVKRNHPDAIRIRVASSVGEHVGKVFGTETRVREVKRRASGAGNPNMDGVASVLQQVSGDALQVAEMWADPQTEAILVSRGLATTLTEPDAKIIALPISDLISDAIVSYDKIFIVRINESVTPHRITAIEFDTLMRYFGALAETSVADRNEIVSAIGLAITDAFAPVVRIEDAGQKSAKGLLRAGGLIVDRDSPGLVSVGDVLVPMTRKNDRNGRPILIGPIDWAFLLATEVNGPKIAMDYYAGRPGGLQGRQNQRTFRTALKVRPPGHQTMIRLHARGDQDFPLIGYEIYERELDSSNMTFVGRTDWNGRILIDRTDDPMRLLYVKNGGAVLARLPTVPGLTKIAGADLSGDDMRLQAEAYILGVQNAIVDLVAIRELFAARVRLRLTNGRMKEAEGLLNALREQPTNEKLANDMGRKLTMFLKQIGPKNPNQYRKVENMFAATREMLSKYIGPKLIQELEADMLRAQRNGGKLPEKKKEKEE